jgi:TrmH family RNA methyltransferase
MREREYELISSRGNKTVKYLRSLSLPRNRQKEKVFLVEGVRIIEEAVERAKCIRKLIVTPHASNDDRIAALIDGVEEDGIEVVWVADRVMDYICETRTNQGVMALAGAIEFDEADLGKGQLPLVALCHQLQDPGNMGTIIRVAEAAGAGGVVTTPGTVDCYNPKALRATMGSIFRLPVVRMGSLEDAVSHFKDNGYQVAAAMVSAKTYYHEVDFSKPTVVLFGQEGSGLPVEAGMLSDVQISIPMATMMDSLNVASAASVILYEAVRQRLVSGGEFSKSCHP